jgi:hypothetical protein
LASKVARGDDDFSYAPATEDQNSEPQRIDLDQARPEQRTYFVNVAEMHQKWPDCAGKQSF